LFSGMGLVQILWQGRSTHVAPNSGLSHMPYAALPPYFCPM